MADACKPKHILIVGPSWVGDMVMAQSLFITLKQNHPDNLIDVLAPAWSQPLLARMAEVNRAIVMPLKHGEFGLLTRFKLARALPRGLYQQAIVLPNSWKSALIPLLMGIPIRTGYIGEARLGMINDPRKLDKAILPRTVQRFVALAFSSQPQQAPHCPIPKLAINTDWQAAACRKFSVSTERKILALCPGAEFGPAKRWPAAHYAAVAKEKYQQGWQVWLFGSEKDRDIAENINRLSNYVCCDFSGRTSLDEAVDLLSLSTVVVSNDSGLMHIAAALDRKLIAIYGSSDPGFTPPLHPHAKIINLQLACSPCFARECPLGHTHCLTEISAKMVLEAIDD